MRKVFVMLGLVLGASIALAGYEFKVVSTKVEAPAKSISNCLTELEAVICGDLNTKYSLSGDHVCTFEKYWSNSTGIRLVKEDGKHYLYAAGLKMPIQISPADKATVEAALEE